MPLEVLFGAAAEAIIGQTLEAFDFKDNLRRWLGRDPAKLALQKALARAYTTFTRQYPDLTGHLFTEPFLAQEAAPELAKLLTRHLQPDPALFAGRWVNTSRHHVHCAALVTPEGEPTPLAVQAASDFLHWLEAELKAEDAFRPLFDARLGGAARARSAHRRTHGNVATGA